MPVSINESESNRFFAHSIAGADVSKWQLLPSHLDGTAKLAQQFAAAFNAGDWGYILGMLHDLGKYAPSFQAYLYHANKLSHPLWASFLHQKGPHAFHGAKLAAKKGGVGKMLAYALAGHHTGLPDWNNSDSSNLKSYLDEARKLPPIFLPKNFESDLIFPGKPKLKIDSSTKERPGFQLAFFIRMIFSCLVDGDFLDTEAFIEPQRTAERYKYPTLEKIAPSFFDKMADLMKAAKPTNVNTCRREIFQACAEAAKLPQGLFSLTVPTGGGKTLASLGFALKHAHINEYRQNRIIYVIPYTSIIEQNAAEFRRYLGYDSVLEHHCNFIPDDADSKSKLAAENWDAPVIVTTSVQFFNSLFANKTSKTRKLHNIANSIIILDEAQMLPVEHLQPCMEALRELTLNYNCSVVLCTATQPALTKNDEFQQGLENIREIIPNPQTYFQKLKRVNIKYSRQTILNSELVEQVKKERQALVIVNTRKHARTLYGMLDNMEGCYHLSALMCPAHRSEVLKNIRERLDNSEPCRVISTQLIEAGVNVDFPTVFRSIAGLDSIAQAAGRCNREGSRDTGTTHVFIPEEPIPIGFFRETADAMREVIPNHIDDPLSPAAVEEYFRMYYWKKQDKMDKCGILASCRTGVQRVEFQFEEMARFSIIENVGTDIIVPYDDEAKDLIAQLRDYISRDILRKLQRYNVHLYPHEFNALHDIGAIEMLHEQIPMLRRKDAYDKNIGLNFDLGPENLCI